MRPARSACQTAECSESTGTISPPPAARALATTGPGRDQALLVGEREPLAGFERGERRRQPREADDRVQHDVGVGMRGELGERVGIVEAGAGEVGRDAELGPLPLEQLGVAAGGEGDDPEIVAVAARARRAPGSRSIRSTRG